MPVYQVALNSPTVTGDDVKPFTDSSNKKNWFETIDGCLAAKAGPSGFLLSYIVRGYLEGDYGHNFGQPSFDEELAACGRRGGLYYPQDNKTVWVFLKLKTQGTAAWETIKGMTNDGRGAYLALMADFMGTSVQQLLMKRAETSLNSLVFDGSVGPSLCS